MMEVTRNGSVLGREERIGDGIEVELIQVAG